jgi:hypothetical protein
LKRLKGADRLPDDFEVFPKDTSHPIEQHEFHEFARDSTAQLGEESTDKIVRRV